MALVHLVLSLTPYSRCFVNGVVEERGRVIPPSEFSGGRNFSGRIAATGLTKRLSLEARASLSRRDFGGGSTLKVTEAENGQIVGLVEIPVTCYQLLGLSLKAEKDEVVKAVMDLKSSEIEAGYSGDAITSRQHLLMDIRDKLLFESEYAGNLKENILPKSSLRIPWIWLSGALCLLQEEYNGRLKVFKIDHDANPKLIEEYKVYGLPTLILFKNGEEVPESRREGAITKIKLKEYLDSLLSSTKVV